ncbi:PAS domain S-box protein [Ensifer adhaerens]|uniref:PAS domain S-box protein n=1 Tax=Ensifer adhaerens TaxID=106592 RepID=UPI00211A25F4|nr:PAS domain S-box protein [Ensifer adhaerens]
MAERGQSFEIGSRLLRKDLTLLWVASSVSALRDKDRGFQQATAIIVDITECKRAQDVERRLAAIIASSNDAILGIDLGMKITSWNTGTAGLYRYTADGVIGRSFLVLVHEDRQGEEPAILRQVSAGLKVEPYETARLHKDGRSVPVLLSVSPIFDAFGVIVGASKIAHDISARKDTERLQSVLVGELNHRVKNLFATVLAISRQTLGHGQIDAADVRSFEARLSSMAHAHDLHDPWDMGASRTTGDRRTVDFTLFREPICGYRPFNPGPFKGSRVDLPGAS